MKAIIWVGAVLALLGVIGLAIPAFTTSTTKNVAQVGDLKVQAKEQQTHTIPPPLSVGLLAVGVILIGAGALANRT